MVSAFSRWRRYDEGRQDLGKVGQIRAISGQIRATSKSLGEEDCMGGGGSKSVGSRLRFIDHHLRQQRALQQLGMIQHNAWRPQRGLPESAVSVLRAWLFEHFLHPYAGIKLVHKRMNSALETNGGGDVQGGDQGTRAEQYR